MWGYSLHLLNTLTFIEAEPASVGLIIFPPPKKKKEKKREKREKKKEKEKVPNKRSQIKTSWK